MSVRRQSQWDRGQSADMIESPEHTNTEPRWSLLWPCRVKTATGVLGCDPFLACRVKGYKPLRASFEMEQQRRAVGLIGRMAITKMLVQFISLTLQTRRGEKGGENMALQWLFECLRVSIVLYLPHIHNIVAVLSLKMGLRFGLSSSITIATLFYICICSINSVNMNLTSILCLLLHCFLSCKVISETYNFI